MTTEEWLRFTRGRREHPGRGEHFAVDTCEDCGGTGEREVYSHGADVLIYCGCDTGQSAAYRQMGWRYRTRVTLRTMPIYERK